MTRSTITVSRTPPPFLLAYCMASVAGITYQPSYLPTNPASHPVDPAGKQGAPYRLLWRWTGLGGGIAQTALACYLQTFLGHFFVRL